MDVDGKKRQRGTEGKNYKRAQGNLSLMNMFITLIVMASLVYTYFKCIQPYTLNTCSYMLILPPIEPCF